MRAEARREEAQKSHRKRRWLRGCGATILVLILLVLLAGGSIWWLLRSEPKAYTEATAKLEQIDVPTRKARAEAVQNRFFSELLSDYGETGSGETGSDDAGSESHVPNTNSEAEQNRHGSGNGSEDTPASSAAKQETHPKRTIEITVEDFNIWLDQGLPDWLKNQNMTKPRELQRLLIAVRNGQPTVMVQVVTPQIEQIISLDCFLELQPDGQLLMRVDRITGGNMPIPADQLLSRFNSVVDDRTKEAMAKLKNAVDGMKVDPVLKDYNPPRRLGDFDMNEERIRLTVEQLPKKK